MPRHSSTAVRLTVVPLLAASFLAGCGDDEETAYCVDENDEVVENRYCEDEYDGVSSGGVFFWYFGAGGGNIARGTKLSGGERISASDRARLAQRGGFGSRSTGNSNGIGKVSASRGGSGGG